MDTTTIMMVMSTIKAVVTVMAVSVTRHYGADDPKKRK
jgi:hypothetical protein